MKKIIKFIKNNILGFLVGLSLCLNGVIIAGNMLSSEQVSYLSNKTSETTVKGSLDELSGNWTKERDRFEKEMVLAPNNKVLLIENSSYEDLINGNYRSQYNVKSFLATLHIFWFRYNMPVFFMPNKQLSALFIKKYFEYYLKENLHKN